MQVEFASFGPMHEEIREELKAAMERVMDESWFIRGKECTSFEWNLPSIVDVNSPWVWAMGWMHYI